MNQICTAAYQYHLDNETFPWLQGVPALKDELAPYLGVGGFDALNHCPSFVRTKRRWYSEYGYHAWLPEGAVNVAPRWNWSVYCYRNHPDPVGKKWQTVLYYTCTPTESPLLYPTRTYCPNG